jgi:hypothetical protein
MTWHSWYNKTRENFPENRAWAYGACCHRGRPLGLSNA